MGVDKVCDGNVFSSALIAAVEIFFSPQLRGGFNGSALNSISAIPATDIWAGECNGCGDVSEAPPLIEHWDGTAWSINPAPIEFGGVSANTVLAFPSGGHIFVGGFAFAQSGPTSMILKGVEG